MLNSLVSVDNSLKSVLYSLGHINSPLNFVPLNPSDVLDVQINWSMNEMYTDGYMIFEDNTGIVDMLTHTGNLLFKITATDNFNVSSEYTFIVTRIEQHMDNAFASSLRLEFIDPVYRYMINCYVGKGYNNIKVSDIVKDYLIDDITTKGGGKYSAIFPSIYISDTSKVHDSLVVPVHKPFSSFITNREVHDSFLYYNTRSGIVMSDIFNIKNNMLSLSDGKSGAIFKIIDKTIPEDFTNPFNIYDIKILSVNSMSNSIHTPNTLAIELDYESKTPKAYYVRQDYVNSVINDTSTIINRAGTIGSKNIEIPQNAGGSIFRLLTTTILENVTMEITITGSFMYNLLNKVYVDIPTRMRIQNGVVKSNTLLSGEYTILKIVDKFSRGHFSQVLTLGRIGVNLDDKGTK